jgi:putative peptide zinc metalloprotease protein
MIQFKASEHGSGVVVPPPGETGQTTAGFEVPERPTLAPNIHLVGELAGTSFVDRQWLVQRNGHFMQLTELLYRIAERANGDRTLDEIAASVTDSTEWEVTADDVRQLIGGKLIPSGLIVAGDGRVVSRPSHPGGSSPLALKLRFRLLGPRALVPLTTVLQFLFAPPVLISILIAQAIAHAWLYLKYGVANSIGAALFTPGALLVVVAIMLASSVFHELGHASALRYGGGQAREIGGGLYLLLPALYTDVTDGYRLGRWARVRTALGGVYFHLIVALGLVALYRVSRYELLPFVVLLIDMEIIRQFFPLVRLDGYWLLTDLTGVPDFFSQMRPFLRSLVPSPRSKGTKLPSLKPWAATVFAGYILVTIPVLAVLFLLSVTSAPVLVATTWDSLAHQTAVFDSAWNTVDFLRISASVTSMVLLALPVFATCYFLCSVARRATTMVWTWSTTPARRMAAGLGTSCTIVLLGVLWIPELPPAGVERFAIGARSHTLGRVSYAQSPPVGGPHAPTWQNCGYYDTPIVAEHGVASLAQGAVWITYRPDLPQAERDVLRRLARDRLVLVSPYPELPVPVVASAWGRQLRLDSAADARLGQFVRAFQRGLQAPERGRPCTGGVGTPQN